MPFPRKLTVELEGEVHLFEVLVKNVKQLYLLDWEQGVIYISR